jgi:dihydrofolate reductase
MSPPIRLYMSMSLDGLIAGPDDREGREFGRGGGRLFNWLDDRMSDGPSGQVFRELMATGAVISGQRTFELAGRWQGDHHDGVPIFVLTLASRTEMFRRAARSSSPMSRTAPSGPGPPRSIVP